jgi:hypothetical protein
MTRSWITNVSTGFCVPQELGLTKGKDIAILRVIIKALKLITNIYIYKKQFEGRDCRFSLRNLIGWWNTIIKADRY